MLFNCASIWGLVIGVFSGESAVAAPLAGLHHQTWGDINPDPSFIKNTDEERDCNECIEVSSLYSEYWEEDTSKWLGKYCYISNKIGIFDNEQAYPVYKLENGVDGIRAEITASEYIDSKIKFFLSLYDDYDNNKPLVKFINIESDAKLIDNKYIEINNNNNNVFNGKISEWETYEYPNKIYIESKLIDNCKNTGFDLEINNSPDISDVYGFPGPDWQDQDTRLNSYDNNNGGNVVPDKSYLYGLHGAHRNKGDISGLYAPKDSMIRNAECNECIEVISLNSQHWREDTSKWLGSYCYSGNNNDKTNYPIYELTNGNFAKITIGPYFTTNLEFFINFYDNNKIQLSQFLYIGSNAEQISDENSENKYILISNDNNPFDGINEYNWITNVYPGSIKIIAKLDENNCKQTGFDIEAKDSPNIIDLSGFQGPPNGNFENIDDDIDSNPDDSYPRSNLNGISNNFLDTSHYGF